MSEQTVPSDPFAGVRLQPSVLPVEPFRAAGPRRSAPAGGQHRLNTVLAVVLVAIVAVAPIPLASNRPAFWMIWSVVIGFAGMAYGAGLLRLDAGLRLPLRRLAPETALLALVLCYLVVQMLPLRFLSMPIKLQNGGSIVAPTISLDPGGTLLEAINLATYGLLFFLFSQIAVNQVRARRVLVALFLIVFAFALYGLVSLTQLGDTLLGFDKLFYQGYATGTFVNRNSYATFLAAGVAIGVTLVVGCFADSGLRGPARWTRVAQLAVAIVFILAALLASASRMGVVAAAVGSGVAFLAGTAGLKGAGRLRLGFVVVGVVAALGLVALYGTGLVDRVVLRDSEGRLDLYEQVWAAIVQRPWSGYGGGSFAAVFPLFQHAPLNSGFIWDRAHSSYLTLWFELGVIVGSLPLLIVVLLGVRAVRALGNPSFRLSATAALGVVTVFAVHSLVDFSAEIEANAFLFLAVLALPAAGRKRGVTDAG